MMNLDLYLFNLINGFAGRYKWLDMIGVFMAKYFIYILCFLVFLPTTISAGLWADWFPSFAILYFALISSLFALFFAKVINLFYKRKRPSEISVGKALIKHWHNPSFPSRHTSFIFALSFFILFFNFYLGALLLVFSVIIALSRIFVGVHWPSDILAGIMAGLISAILTSFIF